LELKRNDFPRFYFLSDDELLEILANSTDINVVQGYLKALFDGIVKLQLDEVGRVEAMKSKEGEIVYFNKNVNVGGQPEVWLSAVQKEMKEALLKKLKEGYKDYINANGKTTKREEWVCLHPAQVVTTIGMVRWCTETEETILAMPENPMALAEAYETNVNQLKHLTAHIRRTDLTELLRTTLVALIT
jgi:dynein heavy chain